MPRCDRWRCLIPCMLSCRMDRLHAGLEREEAELSALVEAAELTGVAVDLELDHADQDPNT